MISALRDLGNDVRECALLPKTAPTTGATGAAPRPHGIGGRLLRSMRLPRTVTETLEVLYDHRGRRLLRAAARDFAPHFVYERHALHCRAGLDVARELGVPLLLEVNAPMVDEMQELGLLRFPARAAATERAVLAGADMVLPVTAVLGERLLARGARAANMRVIGNGADPRRYGADAVAGAAAVRARLQLPGSAFVLGFVGYVRPWHRLDLMLQAMASPPLAAVHLLLIGRGPALPALQQEAQRLGIAARLHAVGDVDAAALPAHQLACDAALIPAINPYASPLKLFDALAAGVPVLAPDQPNLRETITSGTNGLLFAPGDGAALAAGVQALAADAALRQRLGAAGRASLERQRWTWTGNAERVIAAYASLRPSP
jgi:glycosyltransferase involved in cell wall biosynthesis